MLIATMHGKEKVIAPALEKTLGVICRVPDGYDTDALGTFTGEVERRDDPVTTLRHKCLRAIDHDGGDLVVASEGSFGPHPQLFFAPADEELLMLIDTRHGLEIMVREISTETNFGGREIGSLQDLETFAGEACFPSHALILRDQKDSRRSIIKGITGWAELRQAYARLMQTFGSAYAETDMRAMHNPTRMNVIGKAAEKLVAKIQSTCPACGTPGYAVTASVAGLPCIQCGSPTRSPLYHRYGCQRCLHEEEKMYPHQRTTEEPLYCDVCNP